MRPGPSKSPAGRHASTSLPTLAKNMCVCGGGRLMGMCSVGEAVRGGEGKGCLIHVVVYGEGDGGGEDEVRFMWGFAGT